MSAPRRRSSIPSHPAAVTLLVIGACLISSCGSETSRDAGADGKLVVMTRNLYLGAPLEPLLQGLDPTRIPALVGATWRTVQASDVPGRMERVVEEIATAGADLVALQEAALFQTRPVASGAGAAVTAYDFVELIQAGLRARGLSYAPAAVSTNFDAELPDDAGQLVRFVDRDVVLARNGVRISDVRTGTYEAKVGFTVGPVSATIPRGWASIRFSAEGVTARLVATHLEISTFASIQEAQARELVALVQGDEPVIVAADLNSAADGSTTASYGTIRSAGFGDPWLTLRPGDPGLTCCFAPDLRDPSVSLTERIDVVLQRGSVVPSDVTAVGATASSKTASGVYPSDHAGLVTAYAVR